MTRFLTFLLALLFSVSSQAQLPPYGLQVYQGSADGSTYVGRWWVPASSSSNYLLMYDGASTLPVLTGLGSGLSYSSGVLTAASVPQFNFGDPVTRTLSVSTVYQASDPTKASVVTVSPQCTNATTVVAASACTLQARQSNSSGLTCSSGTITATWTSQYALGLLLTNTSGSPFALKLGIGRYFILCPTSGTFTVASAVDQTAQ